MFAPAVLAANELRIRIVDSTGTMSDKGKLDRVKPAMKSELEAAGTDGAYELQEFEFDSELRPIKTAGEIAAIHGKRIINPASYEAMRNAINSAWHAVENDPSAYADIVLYTDGWLTLPSDTFARLAREVGNAPDKKAEDEFANRYRDHTDSGHIRVHFVVLGSQRLNSGQRDVARDLGAEVLSRVDPRPWLLNWFVNEPCEAKTLLLGLADRERLQGGVDLGTFRFYAVGVPGLAADARFRLSAMGPGGVRLGVSPETVPYSPVPTMIKLTAPVGAKLDADKLDLIVKCSPEEFFDSDQAGVSRKAQCVIRNAVSIVYGGSRVEGPYPPKLENIPAGGRCPTPLRWLIISPPEIVSCRDDFPIDYSVHMLRRSDEGQLRVSLDEHAGSGLSGTPKPDMGPTLGSDEGQLLVSLNGQAVNGLSGTLKPDAVSTLRVTVERAPVVPGTYEIALETTGKCLAQSDLPRAYFTVPEAPNVRIVTIDSSCQVERGTESAFKAFSIQSDDVRANGTVTVSLSEDDKPREGSLALLKLKTDSSEFDLLRCRAEIPVLGQASIPCRIAVNVPSSATGSSISFKLSVQSSDVPIAGGSPVSVYCTLALKPFTDPDVRMDSIPPFSQLVPQGLSAESTQDLVFHAANLPSEGCSIRLSFSMADSIGAEVRVTTIGPEPHTLVLPCYVHIGNKETRFKISVFVPSQTSQTGRSLQISLLAECSSAANGSLCGTMILRLAKPQIRVCSLDRGGTVITEPLFVVQDKDKPEANVNGLVIGLQPPVRQFSKELKDRLDRLHLRVVPMVPTSGQKFELLGAADVSLLYLLENHKAVSLRIPLPDDFAVSASYRFLVTTDGPDVVGQWPIDVIVFPRPNRWLEGARVFVRGLLASAWSAIPRNPRKSTGAAALIIVLLLLPRWIRHVTLPSSLCRIGRPALSLLRRIGRMGMSLLRLIGRMALLLLRRNPRPRLDGYYLLVDRAKYYLTKSSVIVGSSARANHTFNRADVAPKHIQIVAERPDGTTMASQARLFHKAPPGAYVTKVDGNIVPPDGVLLHAGSKIEFGTELVKVIAVFCGPGQAAASDGESSSPTTVQPPAEDAASH